AAAAEALMQRVTQIRVQMPSLEAGRRAFLAAQLEAAGLRLRLLRGDNLNFEEEARGMYGIDLRVQPLGVFDPVLARIEQLVPGPGPLADLIEAYQDRFVIPPDRH